ATINKSIRSRIVFIMSLPRSQPEASRVSHSKCRSRPGFNATLFWRASLVDTPSGKHYKALMLTRRCFFLLAILLIAFVLYYSPHGFTDRELDSSSQGARDKREQAYRANNLGVAFLEQFKYNEGAEQFRRALQIDPSLAIARINLCVALYNVPD